MSTPLTVPRNEPAPAARRIPSALWKLVFWLAVVLAAGAAYYFGAATVAGSKVKDALNYLNVSASHRADAEAPDIIPRAKPSGAWDELVAVTTDEQKAIGFKYAPVKAQAEPIRLELTGRTAYDTNTVTKIRSRFDARVEKVLAISGQKIKKGEPLVELYSTDLAAAKSDFQTKYVQWRHDWNIYNLHKKLVASQAISQRVWVDTQNDEQKTRLEFSLARNKLAVFYEIPEAEIDPLLEHLGDQVTDPRKFGNISDKAKITLKAKTDGYVIVREVVPGNYYESTDVLMQIAPLDHLWVWVNVYEIDQDKVRVGQTMDIQFPFLNRTLKGHVDYVAPEVSKDTRAVQLRASIPNPDARLKSDMLVKAMLDIPPVPGQTLVPRLAVVAISGGEYVFVRQPRPAGAESSKEPVTDRFQRVRIQIAQENTDTVVVASGLKPGQEVVTNGSLILSQLYEDQRMTLTGLPAQ